MGLFKKFFASRSPRQPKDPGIMHTPSKRWSYMSSEDLAKAGDAMDEYLRNKDNDPYRYLRPYINGYYGDLFVKRGGDRDDLEGFNEFVLKFGMDLH